MPAREPDTGARDSDETQSGSQLRLRAAIPRVSRRVVKADPDTHLGQT